MNSVLLHLPPSPEQRINELERLAIDTHKCFQVLRDNVMTKNTSFTYQKRGEEEPKLIGSILDEIFERLTAIEETLDSLKDK